MKLSTLMKPRCWTYLQSISTAARNRQSHVNRDHMLTPYNPCFTQQPFIRGTCRCSPVHKHVVMMLVTQTAQPQTS